MKIVPRRIERNVNVSPVHPLRELAWLLAGALGLLVVAYVLLGVLVDLTVDRLPPSLEQKLSAFMAQSQRPEAPSVEEKTMQALLQRLLQQAPELRERYDFHLEILDQSQVNAMAMPGGRILVTQGLLDTVGSENELSMVLGHELGHYAGRDHLHRLGRGLVFGLAVAMLTGGQGDSAQWLMAPLQLAESSYSRQQERHADLYGLALLQKTYGHAGGATDFFTRIQDKDVHWMAWSATHPLSVDRADDLRVEIDKQHYAMDALTPLPRWVSGDRKGRVDVTN